MNASSGPQPLDRAPGASGATGPRPSTGDPAGRGAGKSADHDFPDELLDRAVTGDRHAVGAVIALIRPIVTRYCRARLHGASGLVDDVVQEVCLAVLTALPQYRVERPFMAFVYGIASHKVTDVHRAAARNRSERGGDVPDRADAMDGPEQHVLRVEGADALARLLAMLPDKQREIVVLRMVVGLSAEETATAVGSTPGAVRVAQHRALARLRRASPEGGAAPPDVVELLAEFDDEPLRSSYLSYVGALAPALDLDAGLAHLDDRRGHRDFVAGLAGRLNLDAGLDALLRSTETPE